MEPILDAPVIPEGSGEQLFAEDPLSLAAPADLLAEPEWDAESPPVATWRFAFNMTATEFELQENQTRYWSTKPTLVTRSDFGIEFQSGFGIRQQIWSLEREYNAPEGPLETRVASYYLDLYRRFDGENGEILIGGGPAIGNLKFDSPFYDTVHRFTGAGASVVGEGFYPLVRFERIEFGVIGRARLALLAPLEDNFEDDSQAVIVDEIGLGVELRGHFGKRRDKTLFVSVGREYQHWADAEFPLSVDQQLESTSFRIGFAW